MAESSKADYYKFRDVSLGDKVVLNDCAEV